MKDVTMIGVGAYKIGLNEEILKKLLILSECEYMQELLEELCRKIVDDYNDSEEILDRANPKQSMEAISLIYDIKADYKFLSSLKIEQESVLSENE